MSEIESKTNVPMPFTQIHHVLYATAIIVTLYTNLVN